MEGQVSTEMIIILAILLAVIVLVATNIQKIAKQNVAAATREGENISGTITGISGNPGKAAGEACTYDYECKTGTCSISGCQ